MLKKILEVADVYQLSEDERESRAHLEHFFAYDISERDENRRLHWHLPFEKIADASLARTIEKACSQLKIGPLNLQGQT